MTSTAPSIDILYIDNHLVAVYKPFGIPTQADNQGSASMLDLTREWIKNEFAKPGKAFLGMVHRLDQPVAGVVLFARTSKAAARISAQFREKTVQKIYRAAVVGVPGNPRGELVFYLKKGKSYKATVFPRPAPDAQRAELTYRMIESFEWGSVLEVIPATGRFHQIRAQLAFIGHPIIGDVKYGAPEPLPERHIALYAQKLIFRHPVTNEETTIESPEPPGWPFFAPPRRRH